MFNYSLEFKLQLLISNIFNNIWDIVFEKEKAPILKDERINLNNRKYIWSKYKLLPFIEKVILNKIPNIDTFIDWFSWTGVVGNHFRKYSKKIIANDLLFSNFIINKVFLNTSKENIDYIKIQQLLNKLNKLSPKKWYVYKNFSNSYFTKENAGLIDSIREEIEYYYINNICNLQEKYILLTSLIFAIDKVSNTVWQYDSFLKHLWKSTYNNWKHLVDSNVYKKIKLKNIEIIYDWINEVYNEDINTLIKNIKGDVLYLDPPYNNRQYIDCYHLLENIVRWEKPEVFWKTKKFKRDNLKSLYSRKRESKEVFKDLIENANVKHIFLSYNNEWIIEDDFIVKILEKKWKVEIFEEDYSIFWNGAWQSKKRKIKERIFYCKVYN